jgi:hypothetical protein
MSKQPIRPAKIANAANAAYEAIIKAASDEIWKQANEAFAGLCEGCGMPLEERETCAGVCEGCVDTAEKIENVLYGEHDGHIHGIDQWIEPETPTTEPTT